MVRVEEVYVNMRIIRQSVNHKVVQRIRKVGTLLCFRNVALMPSASSSRLIPVQYPDREPVCEQLGENGKDSARIFVRTYGSCEVLYGG